jgi:hypothetical protein
MRPPRKCRCAQPRFVVTDARGASAHASEPLRCAGQDYLQVGVIDLDGVEARSSHRVAPTKSQTDESAISSAKLPTSTPFLELPQPIALLNRRFFVVSQARIR